MCYLCGRESWEPLSDPGTWLGCEAAGFLGAFSVSMSCFNNTSDIRCRIIFA